MGTILDQYGTPPPPRLTHDFEVLAKVPKKALGKALEFARDSVVVAREAEEKDVERVATELAIDRSAVAAIVRLFYNLIGAFLSEPSPEKFQEELVTLGLDQDHARLVKDTFISAKNELRRIFRDTFRQRFGPTLSEIRWRVDRVDSSSDPIERVPVGIVGMTLETAHEMFDQTFELRLEELDKLLERLTALRRDLTKAAKAERGAKGDRTSS